FTSSTDRFFLTTTKVRNCLELLLFFSTNLLSYAAAPQSSANLEKVEKLLIPKRSLEKISSKM
ncbi:MAG: hypothetical protein J6M59_13465, partial [Bacteroidaceae bacterium]|nr:hypothetical protein [Bacteroidaceae bacterium]